MKAFKNLKKKIIILTIVVILVNFLFAQSVSAKSYLAQAGGKLLDPVCELLIFVRGLCNKCITN